MDLRIEKTYRALSASFTELMEEKRYDDITVAELCDRAMIRRTTFYKHFADKDEFFAFYIATLHDEFSARIEGAPGSETLSECSAHMFRELTSFLTKHEAFVDNVLKSSSAPILLDELSNLIARQVLLKACELGGAPGSLEAENAAVLYAGGMVAMLKRWWVSGRDSAHLPAVTRVLNDAAEAISFNMADA